MNPNMQSKDTMKTIVGVCFILVSILSIGYGATLFPVSVTNVDFMSFVVGGVIGIAIGASMISRISLAWKQLIVLAAGIIVSGYCFILDMDLILKLISTVCIMGLAMIFAFLLSQRHSNRNTLKICKRCSAVSPEQAERFAAEHGYDLKYGCIGRCQQGHAPGESKRYIGTQNGQVIEADSDDAFFAKLTHNN